MKIRNKSANGYNAAGQNLAKALAASFTSVTKIYVECSRLGNKATLLLDGQWITLSGQQIDGALGVDCFGAPPMADKPLGLLTPAAIAVNPPRIAAGGCDGPHNCVLNSDHDTDGAALSCPNTECVEHHGDVCYTIADLEHHRLACPCVTTAMEHLRIDGKRAVLFANPSPKDGHFYPSFVIENEAGHNPTDWDWGTDLQHFEKCVLRFNAERGYTEADAAAIITSSFRASRRLHARGVRLN